MFYSSVFVYNLSALRAQASTTCVSIMEHDRYAGAWKLCVRVAEKLASEDAKRRLVRGKAAD